MNESWRIELFGGLQARQGERVIARFRTRRVGVLLGYLAFHHRHLHARDALIELLWPECAPTVGRNRLSVTLSSLRRQLEPPGTVHGSVLLANHSAIGLNTATTTTDVADFEAALRAAQAVPLGEQAQQLEQAVDLYQGELLAGFYDDWIAPEQQRLADSFFQATQRLATLWEESGDRERALRVLQRAAGLDPLREETQRALMRLYALLEQPALALRHYHELERVLQQKMGLGPGTATRHLARQIQEQWPASTAAIAQPMALTVALDTVPRAAPRETLHAQQNQNTPTAPTAPTASTEAQNAAEWMPKPLTRFFGREAEIAQLCEWMLPGEDAAALWNCRLVTLTGHGGSGKTRLVIEAARHLAKPHDGQTLIILRFVPLADVSDARLLPDAMLQALRLTPAPGVPPLETILEWLGDNPALLVFDCFEHLVTEGAPLVRELLERAPGLACLVTSRRRLGLAGERELVLWPLPTPPLREQGNDSLSTRLPLSDLLQNEAVVLFMDRAHSVRPELELTPENAPAIAQLCRLLEGLPLAIELAAARALALSPQQMVEHLDDRLDFLRNRHPHQASDPRHRTLRAALDWSHDLLAPPLQRFFASLSVFQGGWTLEAATLCLPAPEQNAALALDYLEELRESSLILAVENGAGMRFRMLETLREHAAERCAQELAPSERHALHQGHATFFLELAEQAALELRGPEQSRWLAHLSEEYDNFRAALKWLLEQDAVGALRLAGALWWFWFMHGHLHEGREWLARARETYDRSSPTAPSTQVMGWRARVLSGASFLAWRQGDFALAGDLCEQSLELCRALGDRQGIADSLVVWQVVRGVGGDLEASRNRLEECLALFRDLNDLWGQAFSLHALGALAEMSGDAAAAVPFQEHSLALFRAIGVQQGVGYALLCLGNLARRLGDCERAKTFCKESQTVFQAASNKEGVAFALLYHGLAEFASPDGDMVQAGALMRESLKLCRPLDIKWILVQCLEGLAILALASVGGARAAQLGGGAAALREAIGTPLPPVDRPAYDAHVALLRGTLGEAAFHSNWSLGQTLPLSQILDYALEA